jgi:hypothetical protein
MDMSFDNKEPKQRWLAVPGCVLPEKTSPSGKQVPARILRQGQVIRTKGALLLGEWGQHGWTDIARAVTDSGFSMTIVKVELSGDELSDEHRTCARSMRVLRIVDATNQIANWVVAQAERICASVNDGLKHAYVDLISVAKKALESPRPAQDVLENLQVGIEVLTNNRASSLERAIVAAANLAHAACVSFDDKSVAKSCRDAIVALVKLGDERFEYPGGFAEMLLGLFGESRADASGESSPEPISTEPTAEAVPVTVEHEESVAAMAPAPQIDRSILVDIPTFDRRVLERLRAQPPKTNTKMAVIAHDLDRPEEEVRAAIVRLLRVGLAGFGNRSRREAHATFQPKLSGKPIDSWFQPVMEQLSSTPKMSITGLATDLQMEREDALQVCVMLEQRGLVRLSGPGKSLAELVPKSGRFNARKPHKKSTPQSPSMSSPSRDDLTRRTDGTLKAEQTLADRPTAPPTRRVNYASF